MDQNQKMIYKCVQKMNICFEQIFMNKIILDENYDRSY
jgi:hypothetical protein